MTVDYGLSFFIEWEQEVYKSVFNFFVGVVEGLHAEPFVEILYG